MFVRLSHALGRFVAWVAGVVKQVGGSLAGGRSGDEGPCPRFVDTGLGYAALGSVAAVRSASNVMGVV